MRSGASIREDTERVCDAVIDWCVLHDEFPVPVMELVFLVHERMLQRIRLLELSQKTAKAT